MTTPAAAAKKRFVCTDCAAEFSRKDHAKRHKLSHQRPKFACAHPGCGLFFHRRDVLRRHEAVHRPENAEKRRRPRRGPLPPALPRLEGHQRQQQPSSSSSSSSSPPAAASPGTSLVLLRTVSGSVGSGDAPPEPPDYHHATGGPLDSTRGRDGPACLCHMPNGTVCVSCSAEMVRLADGRLPAGSEEAIKFCMTHFIQSQLKWFPFIRPQSLRAGWLRSGRALLLAALGARGIKEYKALAGDLWAEAVRRVEAWAFSSPAASGADALSNFQTKILVLDYLQWSEDNRHPEWVGPMLDEMAYREARELASMLVDRPAGGPAHTSLEHEEASQEEIRWTLWKFYCTATRAMLLGFTILPPRLFQTLDLPGDPNRLLALWKNSSGRESDRSVSSMRSESCGRGLTLPGVLDALLSDDGRRAALPGMLSLTGKYIVLHAILYLSETMVEESADAESAAREPPGWQTETRERVYLLVVRWRQCFWIPPEITWKTAFPEFGSLQSIMFVHYLAVRIGQQPVRDSTGARPVRCARTPYARYAIRCIVTIHVSMKNNDLVDVAATGRWWLDGATWRTGGLAAKYAMDWFRDRARFGFEDEDIEYLQSLESAMASYSDAGSYDGASYSPARLAQLERSVRHLWTMVLGTESWLDSRFAEPSEPSHR